MRLPFVSRARHDAVCRQLAAEISEGERIRTDAEALVATMVSRELLDAVAQQRAELRADLVKEQGRTRVLTRFLLRMKRDGAMLLPANALRRQPDHRAPTPIYRAIDDNARARSNPRLRAHLVKWAADAQREGLSEATILDKLRSWGAPTHDDDDAAGDDTL